VKQIRKRLTYANVMSSIAVFLVLGGATAIAAKKIGKNDLKANSVTTAKIKRNAVTTSKIKNSAITTNKIANEAVTGQKINESTLAPIPSALNSVTTDEVRSSKGTLSVGQAATAFEYGGVKLIVNCEVFEPGPTPDITARVYIESSNDGTTFLSWMDSNKSIGPATPSTEREVTHPISGSSGGPMSGEAGAPINVTTAGGASFAGTIGVASEKDSNTCWYWFHGTIIS
jgi:hypothetical protein